LDLALLVFLTRHEAGRSPALPGGRPAGQGSEKAAAADLAPLGFLTRR
jgi:hypothetical protein